MAKRNTERKSTRFIKGIREHDFVELLHELFDEEFAQEIWENIQKAEFMRTKSGGYRGEIFTDMFVFVIEAEKDDEGWHILHYDFDNRN